MTKYRVTMDGDTNKPVSVDITAETSQENEHGTLILTDGRSNTVARFRNWTWVERIKDDD